MTIISITQLTWYFSLPIHNKTIFIQGENENRDKKKKRESYQKDSTNQRVKSYIAEVVNSHVLSIFQAWVPL